MFILHELNILQSSNRKHSTPSLGCWNPIVEAEVFQFLCFHRGVVFAEASNTVPAEAFFTSSQIQMLQQSSVSCQTSNASTAQCGFWRGRTLWRKWKIEVCSGLNYKRDTNTLQLSLNGIIGKPLAREYWNYFTCPVPGVFNTAIKKRSWMTVNRRVYF